MHNKLKKCMSLCLCLLLCVFLLGDKCLASGSVYTYVAIGQLGYLATGEHNQSKLTGTLSLVDEDGNSCTAYCIDADVDAIQDSKYGIENLEVCKHLGENEAAKIREILINSYPYITLDEIRQKSGKDVTNIEEAITATQLAVWYYANQKSYAPYVEPDDGHIERTEALRDWYLTLPGDSSSTKKANIIIAYTADGDTIDITYQADARNADGTEIALSYVINPAVTVLSEGKDADGTYHVIIKNPGKPITFTVSGTQFLGRNAYFFSPENGRYSSQSLAGVTDASTMITASKDIFVKPTPTSTPTATPTAKPTCTPTAKPTCTPTATPTCTPTAKPTCTPTAKPTCKPTVKPTCTPKPKPTCVPKPTPTQNPCAPKTGDTADIQFWIVLAILSACSGAAVFVWIKLKKRAR